MDSFYFLGALIGILLLLRWYIRSESSDDAETVTKGLFGLREKFERPPPFKAKGD